MVLQEQDIKTQLEKFDEKLSILDSFQRNQLMGQLVGLEAVFLKKEFNFVENEKKPIKDQGRFMRSLSSSFKVVRAFVSEKIQNKNQKQWE